MNHLVIALTFAAHLVAIAVGAHFQYRWMQRTAKGASQMGIVSTATMIDRLVAIIDTRKLRIDEIGFVNQLKEKVKRSRIVDLTADEVEKLDAIHGRIFR
ncbi:hypothetical protein [Cupriavidus sp. DL-D2]|uniref:hypothetical protein n=1 Tax=Cupriavidus sp. DL-D2 TaxID=3144974 RepID=UPI003215CE27